MKDRYFDNAATTPIDPLVLAEMLPYFGEHFGNAHSLHHLGREAREAVEQSRITLANLLALDDPSQVVFTSGATESNNWVLDNYDQIAMSPFEHNSVLEPGLLRKAKTLANHGYGLLPPEWPCDLVSVMTVNNETGAIIVPPTGTWTLHRDITQSFGKVPISLEGVSFASFSGHKIYGPKGVGALVMGVNTIIEPYILGGGQEFGQRAGTLNVSGIVGIGAAAQLAFEEMDNNLRLVERCRYAVVDELKVLSDYRVNESHDQSPYILSVSFRSLEGETLVIELDRVGFCISSGAACSSGSTESSHVLTALGLDTEWSRGTIRVSFGKFNTVEASRDLGKAIVRAVESTRKLRFF